MSLPDDVLDYIFGFLQSDIASLKACSQSHPKFRYLVARYLYAHITLSDDDRVNEHGLQTLQMARFISNNPYITNYIRSVEVHLTFALPSSFQYMEGVLSVLRMCSVLNKITYKQPLYVLWGSLSESYRLAILDCFHRPTVEAIHLVHVSGFPLAALNGSKSLKSLSLTRWRPGNDCIPREDTSDPPLLEHLSFNSWRGLLVFEDVVNWVRACNLQSLEFTLHDSARDFGQLSRLFSMCSNTLTTLSLDLGHQFMTYYETMAPTPMPLSLSSLTCLEKLTISSNILTHFSASDSVIRTISQLLKTAPPLQHLTLKFNFDININLSLSTDPGYHWSPLISLISESPSPRTTLCLKAAKIPAYMAIALERAYASLVSCPDLIEMVERRSVVIIMEPIPRVPESSTQDKCTPATDSSNVPANEAKTSSKWLSKLQLFGNKFARPWAHG